MLKLHGIEKGYGEDPLFEGVSLTIGDRERIGLVGRNGHGKSTLMKILAGLEEPDHGTLTFPKDYRIGYLEQHLDFKHGQIIDVACEHLVAVEDGSDQSYKAKTILSGLGFSEEQFEQSPDTLSGGYQVRLSLARLLVSEPNLVLLDEPTNYLDIVSLRWLADFLRRWPGELVLITHDRVFMDRISTHTVGIHRQKVLKIAGGTDKYYGFLAEKEELHEQTRQNQLKRRQHTEDFIRRFRAKASKARAVQSKIKMLEKEDVLSSLDEVASLEFQFPYTEFRGKWPLHVKGLSFGFDETPLIEGLSFSVKEGDRIGVIGKNGKGKTTLLRLLASELSPTSGTLEMSPNAAMGYYGQTNVDRLDPKATIEQEITKSFPDENRTAIRTICGIMLFQGDLAEKKIQVLSGGEKARVLLGKLLAQPSNLLLLDEPTNHLDMESCESLLEALQEYLGTVIFVTHSELFLREVANRLVIFDRGKVDIFEGGYDDFIAKGGFEEFETPEESTGAATMSKKELRRIRADILQRRSKEVGPLAKQVEELEATIVELEAQVEEGAERLLDITKTGFSDEAAKLSRELSESKKRIEELFEELEEITREHDQLDQKFKDELEALT